MASESVGSGQETAALFESCYTELRSLAERYFRRNDRNGTLQPTALVHEAYLRLARRPGFFFESRKHFIAVAAVAMRQILVDREREKRAAKRGPGFTQITITGDLLPAKNGHEAIVDVLALDSALRGLALLSPRQARIVELFSFGGLSLEEVADVLEVSPSLTEKEWRRARAWLRRELEPSAV